MTVYYTCSKIFCENILLEIFLNEHMCVISSSFTCTIHAIHAYMHTCTMHMYHHYLETLKRLKNSACVHMLPVVATLHVVHSCVLPCNKGKCQRRNNKTKPHSSQSFDLSNTTTAPHLTHLKATLHHTNPNNIPHQCSTSSVLA